MGSLGGGVCDGVEGGAFLYADVKVGRLGSGVGDGVEGVLLLAILSLLLQLCRLIRCRGVQSELGSSGLITSHI